MRSSSNNKTILQLLPSHSNGLHRAQKEKSLRLHHILMWVCLCAFRNNNNNRINEFRYFVDHDLHFWMSNHTNIYFPSVARSSQFCVSFFKYSHSKAHRLGRHLHSPKKINLKQMQSWKIVFRSFVTVYNWFHSMLCFSLLLLLRLCWDSVLVTAFRAIEFTCSTSNWLSIHVLFKVSPNDSNHIVRTDVFTYVRCSEITEWKFTWVIDDYLYLPRPIMLGWRHSTD